MGPLTLATGNVQRRGGQGIGFGQQQAADARGPGVAVHARAQGVPLNRGQEDARPLGGQGYWQRARKRAILRRGQKEQT